MSVTTAGSGRLVDEWRDAALPAARTLAIVTLVGVGSGVLTVGVLSRLAMLLLARLNPAATGVTSDDGFVMGQFTVTGSLNLLLVAGPIFGVLGAGFYVALRSLRTGPAWFRLLSISLGPGIVVGAILVHTTGVDFHVLEPLWLTVALFVLLPTTYVVILSVVAERILARHREPPTAVVALGLIAWVPLLPALALLTAGWALLRSPVGATLAAQPVIAWVARGLLALVFFVGLLDLIGDVRTLS